MTEPNDEAVANHVPKAGEELQLGTVMSCPETAPDETAARVYKDLEAYARTKLIKAGINRR
jgi:hypothetical protein